MNFGLTQKQRGILLSILEKYVSAGTVIVYGSRAKGCYIMPMRYSMTNTKKVS